jgi:hypothetical protein
MSEEGSSSQIPIFYGGKKRLVGYYPIEEPGAWAKNMHGDNLQNGDVIEIGKRILEVVEITTEHIVGVGTQNPSMTMGQGIPLEKY